MKASARKRQMSFVVALVVLPWLASTIIAWEIPLALEEYYGVSGRRQITCGVPLLAGQATDVKELAVVTKGSDGKPTSLPAQFRELARWWRADNSLRWVLVDFATEVGAFQTNTVFLTNASVPRAKTSLTVNQDENHITIDTGVARFVMNRKNFNFLEKAILDLDGDGKFTEDENLLATTAEHGTVMEDAFGQRYFGAEGGKSVEVLEAGPVRVCVRAQGKHPPHQGKRYSRGMYSYDVFLHFYAESTDVYADVIIGNNFPQSIGIPAFEDCSLLLKLARGASGYKLLGQAKATTGTLSTGESVALYQDSNGADTWEVCSGLGKMETSGWKPLPAQFTTFRGYKVFRRIGGKEEPVDSGDHARGTLQVWNDHGGVVMHLKHFWQQFPKAAEVAADGTIRIGLFPHEWKFPFMLSDCSAKGHEVILHFFAARNPHGDYARDSSGRPAAEAVADRWDARVFARPPLEHRAAAGALSDLGPYTPPVRGMDAKPESTRAIDSPRMLTDDRLYGNAYGWRVFGERWRSQGGHGSRGARQPIDEDNYLWRWYVTGLKEWLTVGDARSRHFRDVRCYRVDDQDALGFKDWAAFRVANRSERREWTNRVEPDDEEIRKYREGLPDYGTAWEFPNPEHCVLDLLYDRYLLFGDVRSLENMRVAAGHGGYFALGYAPKPGADMNAIGRCLGRAQGWSWRTLERYWELTGDKRADEMLRAIVKAYAPLIGKAPLWFANDQFAHASDWFTQIFTRAAAMTALHTGDATAIEICRWLAEGKEKRWAGSVTYGKQSPKDARTFSTLFAVLYHLTGEEQYKAPLADAIQNDSLLGVGGYFPASDHWLLTHPPKAIQKAASDSWANGWPAVKQ